MNQPTTTHLPQDGDALDDLLGGATVPSTRPAVTPPAHYQPPNITEPCKKCRGSGRFARGHFVGRCFACKGIGTKTFKTAPEVRAAARQDRVQRKVNDAVANLAAFAAAHPDVWGWMDGSDFPFAVSLRDAVGKFGSLTEKQMAAARSAIAKRTEAMTAARVRVEQAPTISMDKIEEAFATARGNGLNKIKVRFAGLTFKPKPDDHGVIYVREDSVYLGKITGGKFVASRECGAERSARVIDVAKDPRAAAVAYGRLTGSCSCCGRELTDPASVAQGIGPICATKFGW